MKMRHNGTKANPGRDKILCLCIAARMDINEIRRTIGNFQLCNPLRQKHAPISAHPHSHSHEHDTTEVK